MKFAIIYYSLGGNTRRIANMIKEKQVPIFLRLKQRRRTQALTTKLSIRVRMKSTADFVPKSKS